ncbi:MAG: hypothetical protein IIX62_02410 [Peptococcaceae bacterium]|jgi:PBP1b-binding outer membrane lipoprotein LpoB|nr:hypothetical protein [Peptococcaceae bacterium]
MKMKKRISVLLIMCLVFGLFLGGCTGNDNPEQQQEQTEQTEQTEQPQVEVHTLTGEFQGMADGHSVEVLVDGEPQMYQFFDEVVASAFEVMESGTAIQFDVEVNAETNAQTIVRLYDAPAQG